jgi:hypothetical protein
MEEVQEAVSICPCEVRSSDFKLIRQICCRELGEGGSGEGIKKTQGPSVGRYCRWVRAEDGVQLP